MGDRIAVLQEGGHLAQFATPAELLMYPADKFVEDFVGADRALKRLALQRVRDIDLWKAADGAGRASRSPRPRTKLERRRHRLPAARRRRRQAAGLAERARPRGRARDRGPPLQAEPMVELDDVLRDALGGPARAPRRATAPVVDDDGRRGRRALARGDRPRRCRRRPRKVPHGAERRRRVMADLMLLSLAQIQIQERDRAELRGQQRLLPGLDRRQLRPLRRPLRAARVPDPGVGADRLRDRVRARAARPPQALAATGPIIGVTGTLYTIPSIALFFLLLPITGRGNLTAMIALISYTLLSSSATSPRACATCPDEPWTPRAAWG